MAILEDREQRLAEIEQELTDRSFYAKEQQAAREHEKELLRIKMVEARRAEVAGERGKRLERILLALIKLPTLLLLALLIPFLLLAGKQVPAFIQQYMNI
jgi:hypothetical protein